ncbi:MAG: hypothetical protein SXU28_12710 [Pseudomonadota bacterium]|nr:hypothetical protein [Pseudomonadota bacterium]
MNSTTSSSPAPQSPRPTGNEKPRPDAAKEPPRKQAETRTARDRFNAKLEQESGKSSAVNDKSSLREEASNRRSGGFDGEYSGSSDQRGGDGGSQSDHSLNAPVWTIIASRADPVSAVGVQGAATVDPAILDRMAAQIAESWTNGRTHEAMIEFPDTALAQSAHISREADGSIAVRIAGLDPRLSALQNAQVQIQLTNALARKRLRVSAVRFETQDQSRPLRDDAGDASAIPRVV